MIGPMKMMEQQMKTNRHANPARLEKKRNCLMIRQC
jgi:hypothetical protein